jgi:hypothetical protein
MLVAVCVSVALAQTARKGGDKSTDAQQAGGDAQAAPKDAQKKKPSPAEAQAAIEAAVALLEAGKSEQAVQALTRSLAEGRLPPGIMAKALFYRGIASRRSRRKLWPI